MAAVSLYLNATYTPNPDSKPVFPRISELGAPNISMGKPIGSKAVQVPASVTVNTVPVTSRSQVKRHTISVFVADESGIINRITGVISRRRCNIESLAVGLNKDKAMFTIVVCGTEKILCQVMEQLNKLVNVIKVEDLSREPQVERGLMLIKLNAYANSRSEVMWLVDIFGGKIVDVSDNLVTVEVTGDPGKMAAVLRNFSKLSIKEITRTGKVGLLQVHLKKYCKSNLKKSCQTTVRKKGGKKNKLR